MVTCWVQVVGLTHFIHVIKCYIELKIGVAVKTLLAVDDAMSQQDK